ncbi:unnamed protein product, partial [Meganyctiphanes norvegica]
MKSRRSHEGNDVAKPCVGAEETQTYGLNENKMAIASPVCLDDEATEGDCEPVDNGDIKTEAEEENDIVEICDEEGLPLDDKCQSEVSNTTKVSFKCPKCDCKYEDECELNKHVEMRHSGRGITRIHRLSDTENVKEEITYIKTEVTPPTNMEKNKIPCAATFESPTVVHKNIYNIEVIPGKSFKCPHCEIIYPEDKMYDFVAHVVMHGEYKYTATFACSECVFKAPSEVLLKEHMSETHVYRCPACVFQCHMVSKMYEHIKETRHHDRSIPFTCFKCDFKTNSLARLKTHLVHTTYRCAHYKCEETFTTRLTLRYHMLEHRDERTYTCDDCDCKFGSKTAFTQHLKVEHGKDHKEEKYYICEECEASFSSKFTFTEHFKVEHGRILDSSEIKKRRLSEVLVVNDSDEEKYNSEVDDSILKESKRGKENRSKNGNEIKKGRGKNIKKKEPKESEEESKLESNDAKTDSSNTNENSPVKVDTSKKSDQELTESPKSGQELKESQINLSNISSPNGEGGDFSNTFKIIVTPGKPRRCPHCNLPWAQGEENDFVTHVLTHGVHAYETVFACSECDSHFPYQFLLKRHLFQNHLYLCSQCDFDCEMTHKLHEHYRNNPDHKLPKPFFCHTCDKRFVYAPTLKSHNMNYKHSKPFLCPKCDFRSIREEKLFEHIVEDHPSLNVLKCDECDFKCLNSADLASHIISHEDGNPFACKECDFKCASKNKLHSHIEANHVRKRKRKKEEVEDTKEKPFTCSECGHKCRKKSGLKLHLKTHGIESSPPAKRKKVDLQGNLQLTGKEQAQSTTNEEKGAFERELLMDEEKDDARGSKKSNKISTKKAKVLDKKTQDKTKQK